MDQILASREHDDAASGSGVYRSTKTYDHNEGLSCTFRQWRATHSHCRLLHGYAFAIRFVFATRELDERHWCFDFGGMKPVRQWLHEMFDHTLLIAADDPERARLEALGELGLADVRILPAVGCEAMAQFVHAKVETIVQDVTGGRVRLESVEVREHGGNSALYSSD
ncbi:MAG: 6-pyruvoyl trahydropterin synthase family protein [Janthinobacterium lividum]